MVEPFAGSAGYSCYGLHWKKQVYLFELDSRIYRVWKYLQRATTKDILMLPNLKPGEKVPDSLAPEERWLLGYCINPGSSTVRNPTKKAMPRSNWNYLQNRIAHDLYKIRHWKIYNAPFSMASRTIREPATWFIDPPYQHQGYQYTAQVGISYSDLGEWCQQLPGQVIVCEASGADWLPFKPLISMKSINKKNPSYIEMVWYNQPLVDLKCVEQLEQNQ